MSMDRLFDKIKQLPTIPKLLHELMQSFNDENARIDEIAAKIAMDQVISVKVLRMANSAALRRGNEVTSIEQAVIRLGFNRLRSVVVASGIIGSFKAPPSFDKNKFWTETFQVATIARTLAQETKALDPETAFTCALIHNIGELLIQSTLPEEAELINMAIQKRQQPGRGPTGNAGLRLCPARCRAGAALEPLRGLRRCHLPAA